MTGGSGSRTRPARPPRRHRSGLGSPRSRSGIDSTRPERVRRVDARGSDGRQRCSQPDPTSRRVSPTAAWVTTRHRGQTGRGDDQREWSEHGEQAGPLESGRSPNRSRATRRLHQTRDRGGSAGSTVPSICDSISASTSHRVDSARPGPRPIRRCFIRSGASVPDRPALSGMPEPRTPDRPPE